MVNINKLNSYENVIIDSDLAKIEDLIQFLQSNKCHKCGGDISQGMPARKCKFTKNKSFIFCESSKELIGYGNTKNKRIYLLPKKEHDKKDN